MGKLACHAVHCITGWRTTVETQPKRLAIFTRDFRSSTPKRQALTARRVTRLGCMLPTVPAEPRRLACLTRCLALLGLSCRSRIEALLAQLTHSVTVYARPISAIPARWCGWPAFFFRDLFGRLLASRWSPHEPWRILPYAHHASLSGASGLFAGHRIWNSDTVTFASPGHVTFVRA